MQDESLVLRSRSSDFTILQWLKRRAMRIALIIVGAGLMILSLVAAVMILFFHASIKGSEFSLLLLLASCSINGFLLFALTSRRVRIDLESERAHSGSKPERRDSESEQARKDLESKKAARLETLLNGAGIALLVLGLTSATVILVTKTSWVMSWLPARTGSLWWLFVPSMLLGHVAVLLAQSEVASQTSLKKKQVGDESRDTTRRTTIHRRRARFRWRFLEKQICYERCDTPRWTADHRRRARFRWHF